MLRKRYVAALTAVYDRPLEQLSGVIRQTSPADEERFIDHMQGGYGQHRLLHVGTLRPERAGHDQDDRRQHQR